MKIKLTINNIFKYIYIFIFLLNIGIIVFLLLFIKNNILYPINIEKESIISQVIFKSQTINTEKFNSILKNYNKKIEASKTENINDIFD